MNILLIAKRSKYEWERARLSLSHDELIAKYSSEHANITAIMESHERQLSARRLVEEVVGKPALTLDDFQDTYWRSCVDDGVFADRRPDMVVVLGGDNSFTAVAQRSYSVPVLAINSDPVLSVGCLTRWRVDTFEELGKLTAAIRYGDYNIEEWTRLESNLLPTVPAISEYYLGETKRKDMSRFVIEDPIMGPVEQKCSGIIIATGVGSTGWYTSANTDRTVEENKFAPTDKIAKYVVTEPYRYKNNDGLTLKRGEIMPGYELVIHSLNDSGGLISADSWLEAPFTRGTTAKIKLGEPAKVVVP